MVGIIDFEFGFLYWRRFVIGAKVNKHGLQIRASGIKINPQSPIRNPKFLLVPQIRLYRQLGHLFNLKRWKAELLYYFSQNKVSAATLEWPILQ